MSFDWKDRPVLVTGAGGFIGSHLTEALATQGARVRAIVHGNMRGTIGHLSRLPESLRDRVEVQEGNICDGAFVHQVMRHIDTAFHLAAITSVAYAYSNPEETILTNVAGTLNTCTAARAAKLRCLVHVSSAGVYASANEGEAITESHPVRAYNPYTASKLAADSVVESFYLSYDVPVTTCRIFNAFGPRISRFLVIPTIIMQLKEGGPLRLGDLKPLRNFTFVDDIVRAFMLMASEPSVIGEVVNFGSPRAISIGQLAQLIADLMGRELNVVSDAERLRPSKSEITRVVADSAKARRLLGWEPGVSLEDGLRQTIDWIVAGGYDNPSLH